MPDWKDLKVSLDGTHYLHKGLPYLKDQFLEAQSFHNPGLAAVRDSGGAFHIDSEGVRQTKYSYIKAFGFYDGMAAIQDESGWYHIDVNFEPLYNKRFSWVGNFQERACVVRNEEGIYFHINHAGENMYSSKYSYCGDYKYGMACVRLDSGKWTHIDKLGKKVHFQEYDDLGVYHKGMAIAKDEKGWFHIDLKGVPCYSERFLMVEPFYNGQALVTTLQGSKAVIRIGSGGTFNFINLY